MATSTVDARKNCIRRQVWDRLDGDHVAVDGRSTHGRIPNFRGADRAADRLAALAAWQDAAVIKAVPDKAQHPARVRALHAGKLVYMAVPKLAAQAPFYVLDPADLTVPPEEAAASRSAAAISRTAGLDELLPVDVVLCGSVAVTRGGIRLGKGAGYSDMEVALLAHAGLIGPHTTIVTTVHDGQIVDEAIPETDHDFSVDYIVTPSQTITCPGPRRPTGLNWHELTNDQIAAIPVLQALTQ